MPNDGSDCCLTCWFNKKNEGQVGHAAANDRGADVCEIRNLPIDDPAYTYCANHPHRNPTKITIPIGPVYTGDSLGNREIWKSSPDTEEIRRQLLELLSLITEKPRSEYPIGVQLDDVVIWQLGEFREKRAVVDLKRIEHFDPETSDPIFGLSRSKTIQEAKQALARIGTD